ncbi:hypothetical protein DKX38_016316 [Salix brachista]|uniref:Uncharacterized protein n=1 Tax=Salix brachista TaxID=2182728 RepID=A0A5N5L7L1_9ROSI|nr:hypothetical protein DKX38_016316 [Salix brachista]
MVDWHKEPRPSPYNDPFIHYADVQMKRFLFSQHGMNYFEASPSLYVGVEASAKLVRFRKSNFAVCCGTMVEAQCHSVEEFQPLLGLKMKAVILAESGMRSILVV